LEGRCLMDSLIRYTNRFFDELEVFEDVTNGHHFKTYMHQAVLEFLENETKETAFAVYQSFFDSYRINLPGESNKFADLLDVLLSYEESAATLIDKQRDHYIHSVYVFLLGLSIYAQNTNFRLAFSMANMDKSDYPYSYDTMHEEFFYRWGLASLFHDVGYPIEIIGKQISKFIGFATEVDSDIRVKSHLAFENFDDLNAIGEVIPKRDFIKAYFEKYDSCVYVDLLKPIDLLAHKLHLSLGVDLKTIKKALDNFVSIMAKSGFIDHGFYSAIIVLRWYGYLIQKSQFKPEYFFYPVLDSASAILLHNYYRNVIMKPPFGKGNLSAIAHPIAFLLILCDELHEWNRKAYGILDRQRTQAADVILNIDDERLDVTYLTGKGMLPANFASEKKDLLSHVLNMDAVFTNGFSVGCESRHILAELAGELKQDNAIVPRPLIDTLESLAISIHHHYNQRQRELFPDKPLAHPNFSDLPDGLKYSNLRQARSIVDKLTLMGWEMLPIGVKGEMITHIPEDIVEMLAVIEHDEWVKERLDAGWRYGAAKSIKKKISPHLVTYDELDDTIKENDRCAVRNIPRLLAKIGMGVYVKEPNQAQKAEISDL
jgi:hypothetical protein